MTATKPKRRLILCAGLQSGGTTLISWCFLQRQDTDGVLDMDNDILRVSFDRVKQPVCWVKMTVGAFRWVEIDELYRDLGWSPEPLLIVRDVRAAYSSLMKHAHGFNGLTAEEPPLRMRFRRFLRDWELFRTNGWPIIKYEDFMHDHRAILMKMCQALNLAWDEGMIAWPKKMADIAYPSDANPTFKRTLAKGNLAAAKLPDKAAIQLDGLPLSELKWLEETFAAYNDFHNYVKHLRSASPEAGPLTMPALQWEGSARERHYRLLSENERLRTENKRLSRGEW